MRQSLLQAEDKNTIPFTQLRTKNKDSTIRNKKYKKKMSLAIYIVAEKYRR